MIRTQEMLKLLKDPSPARYIKEIENFHGKTHNNIGPFLIPCVKQTLAFEWHLMRHSVRHFAAGTEADQPLFYVATNYSGTQDQQRSRFEKITKFCGELSAVGIRAFSPVTHSHPIQEEWGSNKTASFDRHSYFVDIDLQIIPSCSALLIVRCNEDHDESVGIAKEIFYAIAHNMPMFSVDIEDVSF